MPSDKLLTPRVFCSRGWQIIQVNLTSENPREVVPGTTLEFTYSVKWQSTQIPFRKRFDRYLDYNFFEHQVSGSRQDGLSVVRIL